MIGCTVDSYMQSLWSWGARSPKTGDTARAEYIFLRDFGRNMIGRDAQDRLPGTISNALMGAWTPGFGALDVLFIPMGFNSMAFVQPALTRMAFSTWNYPYVIQPWVPW